MTSHSPRHPPIPVVVLQHAEESAMLRHVRSVLVRAPHVRLRHLRRLDDRIAAHLDGLAVAGAYGTQTCTAALERTGAGEVFAAGIRAIEERDDEALRRLIAIAEAVPDGWRGLLSAMGWVSAPDLRGIVERLLAAPDPLRRRLGIATCRMHRVDPGPTLAQALTDSHPGLRSAAQRAAAELGRIDLIDRIVDTDTVVAATSRCLMGDRSVSLTVLESFARGEDEARDAAMQLLLIASDFQRAGDLLRGFARVPASGSAQQKRRIIRACGWLGDTRFVPWLIEQMADDPHSRIAGEAFSLITGADLAALDLERKPPQDAPMGPSDDATDDNVSLDDDESLPWPAAPLVHDWWQKHQAAMPGGSRCFMGGRVEPAHCRRVLRDGAQRQRFIAAQHLCLLAPGTVLFPVCAPAWRQQRRLDAMT